MSTVQMLFWQHTFFSLLTQKMYIRINQKVFKALKVYSSLVAL